MKLKRIIIIFLFIFSIHSVAYCGYNRYIDAIIIHHSGDDVDLSAKEIDAIHKKRGFKEIGYHYLIRRDGTIETGRSINKIGAHAKYRNKTSIGICLNGDTNFTKEQKIALTKLVEDLVSKYDIFSIERHHDKCPGDSLNIEAFESYILKEDVEDVGIASWYLDKITSSGERYNKNALTCALRRRDFGHYYKITNLENGKTIIVKHNDFGPNKERFKNRIVDLTPFAFKKIAKLDKGLVKVKVERIR